MSEMGKDPAPFATPGAIHQGVDDVERWLWSHSGSRLSKNGRPTSWSIPCA